MSKSIKLDKSCHPQVTVNVRQPDYGHQTVGFELSSYLRSLQASQLQAMSEGEELLRSAAGTVCAPTAILPPPTDSCCDPLFPRGMCKRKSWLWKENKQHRQPLVCKATIGMQKRMWQFFMLNVFWEDTQPDTKNLPSKTLIHARDGLRKQKIETQLHF